MPGTRYSPHLHIESLSNNDLLLSLHIPIKLCLHPFWKVESQDAIRLSTPLKDLTLTPSTIFEAVPEEPFLKVTADVLEDMAQSIGQ